MPARQLAFATDTQRRSVIIRSIWNRVPSVKHIVSRVMREQGITCGTGAGQLARRFGIGTERRIDVIFSTVNRRIRRCINYQVGLDAVDQCDQ